MKKDRLSNFELLRIVSMIAIVAIHYFSHGVREAGDLSLGGANEFWFQLLINAGRFGVLCFVMTTGFFMVNKKAKLSSVFKLAAKVWFYAWAFLLAVLIFSGMKDLSLKSLVKSAFPILFKQYWFITTYLMLYMLIPFLNKFIHKAGKRILTGAILALFLIYSVIPMVTLQRWPDNVNVYYNIGLFVMLYMIAAYIKIYPHKIFDRTKLWVIVAISMRLITWATILIIWFIDQKFGKNISLQYFTDFNSPFVIIESVAIFMFFRNLKIGQRKWINWVAASVFAVYLIHCNILFSDTMWRAFMVPDAYVGPMGLFLVNFVVTVLAIFVGSILIDKARGIILDRPIGALARRSDKTSLGRAIISLGGENEET